MLLRIITFVVVGVALVGGSVFADDGVVSECPIQKAMNNLPSITYLVGGEQCHCSKSAETLAGEKGLNVRFAVGEETFDSKSEATIALVSATEAVLAEFATPHVCSKSGTTTIAGQSTSCSKTAARFASMVTKAIDDVGMSYKVGDEECHCPTHAASLAKSSGEPKLYVVGDECTSCETTAKLNLARAKYHAAMEAIVHAEQEVSQAEAATSDG